MVRVVLPVFLVASKARREFGHEKGALRMSEKNEGAFAFVDMSQVIVKRGKDIVTRQRAGVGLECGPAEPGQQGSVQLTVQRGIDIAPREMFRPLSQAMPRHFRA